MAAVVSHALMSLSTIDWLIEDLSSRYSRLVGNVDLAPVMAVHVSEGHSAIASGVGVCLAARCSASCSFLANLAVFFLLKPLTGLTASVCVSAAAALDFLPLATFFSGGISGNADSETLF